MIYKPDWQTWASLEATSPPVSAIVRIGPLPPTGCSEFNRGLLRTDRDAVAVGQVGRDRPPAERLTHREPQLVGTAIERQGQLIEQPDDAQEVGVVGPEAVVAGVEHPAVKVDAYAVAEPEPDGHGARAV